MWLTVTPIVHSDNNFITQFNRNREIADHYRHLLHKCTVYLSQKNPNLVVLARAHRQNRIYLMTYTTDNVYVHMWSDKIEILRMQDASYRDDSTADNSLFLRLYGCVDE